MASRTLVGGAGGRSDRVTFSRFGCSLRGGPCGEGRPGLLSSALKDCSAEGVIASAMI